MSDPIAELVESLSRDGVVDASWLRRWSEAGDEPFAAAWSAAHDLVAMAQLLEVLEHATWLAARPSELARAQVSIPDGWTFGDSEALRHALREPPDLATVVDAWRVVAPHRHGSMRPAARDPARADFAPDPRAQPAPRTR